MRIELPKLEADSEGKGAVGRGMPMVPRPLNPDDIISVAGNVVAGAKVEPNAAEAVVVVVVVVAAGLKELVNDV